MGSNNAQNPRVSVIIPAHNGAPYLGEAIQSVLDQTYPHFELIVVDDASQDETCLVVNSFDDPRVIYIAHSVNRGACNARKTGVRASTGQLIFFLDQDDLFHPQKVEAHIDFHVAHPEIGLTYNAFLNLNPSSTDIRDVANPPSPMTLADLLRGFPVPPSAWVLKREWALLDEIWDESTFLHGREYVFCGRLHMAGCAFAKVDGVLHTRRYHAGRVFSDLRTKCEAELTCQKIVFDDPRCPENVLAIREAALARTYLSWAHLALKQGETSLGQELLREAIRLQPELEGGAPSRLLLYFLSCSSDDESNDHAILLRRLFDQLPPEVAQVKDGYEWAVRQGHLLKGARAVLWDRPDDAGRYFAAARSANAHLDEPTSTMITSRLLDYAQAFGFNEATEALDKLTPYLTGVGGATSVRKLKGLFAFNRAFQHYRAREYREVPGKLVTAITNDPKFATNPGTLSLLLRSTAGRVVHSKENAT